MQTKFDTLFAYLKKNNIVAPFAKLTIRTEPKLLAAARAVYPIGVQRLTTRLVHLGASYENYVRNKLQDDTFKAEALWNGKGRHVSGNRYLVEHVDKPGEYYLAFKPREVGSIVKDEWRDLATKEVIGKPIEFLGKKSPSKTGVTWQVVKLCNVEEIQAGATFDFTT